MLFLLELFEAAAGVVGVGVEFEGFLVVADGGIGHVLVFAFAAEDGVFGCEALQEFVLLVDLFLEGLNLGGMFGLQACQLLPLAVDDAELGAYIALDMGLLDVVTQMDGGEEVAEEVGEVAFVEGSDGIAVFAVGLAFLECLGDEPLVVVTIGKLHDLCAHEDVALTEGRLEGDALERGAAGEGDVGLSASEGASASEVDGHLVERQSLALMDGDGPGESDGELGVGAEQLFLDLLFLLVEGVAHVLPDLALNVVLEAFLGDDADESVFLVDIVDDAEGAVHPALVLVVLDEDDLCAWLELEFHRRGQGGLGEVALDDACEGGGLAFEFGEVLFVGVVDDVAAGGEGDAHRPLWWSWHYPCVEGLEIGRGGGVVADAVEDGDEVAVGLAIDLAELDGDDGHLLPHLRVEEIGAGVEGLQQLAVFVLEHGFQLVDVAHEQQLFATKGLGVAGVDAQHLVDEVDDIGTYHRDLVDDDELDLADEFALGSRVLQGLLDMAVAVARVVGQQGEEGQTEEAVEGGASGIDGSDTRRREDDMLLLRVLGHVAEERRLTRPCLSREKERATGIVDDLEGVLPLLVIEIEFH